MSDPMDLVHNPKIPRTAYYLVGIVVLLLVLLFLSGFAYITVDSDRSRREECITQLQSEAIASVGAAFDTPPAPNPQRDQVVEEIVRTARRLGRADQIC